MCGIVGYVGHDDAVAFLTPALRRLEYRGYDSAGVATLNGRGLEVRKSAGKIAALEQLIAAERPTGRLGIGHTRWATHGRPSDVNAHPQLDCRGRLAVVHNGIIENHGELRRRLIAQGHQFQSETDTEVIAHLIEANGERGLPEAVRLAASDLHGSFAIACIADSEPDTIVAYRGGGSPLVLGLGDRETFLASDIPALVGRTRRAVILADGEMAVLTPAGISIRGLDGRSVTREPTDIATDLETVEKGGYPHFMLKEIFEQPAVVRAALKDRVDLAAGQIDLPELGLRDVELAKLTRTSFIGCGTSWHAAMLGKYLVEDLARLPAEAEIASELRHRRPVHDRRVLVVPISQSGETADTLAALRQARQTRSKVVAICNRLGSSVAREADGVLATRAGLEIGVAATKSFTAQLVAVTLVALKVGLARRKVSRATAKEILQGLATAADRLEDLLELNDRIRDIAERLVVSRSCLYLGRGLQYPLALEGALKLKEASYVHAEGYAAGEMKHGPIALIDRDTPVVALAPAGPTRDHSASNIQEVKARDGFVLALATSGDDGIRAIADVTIPIPPASPWMCPILLTLPLQLLAYHFAVLRQCDVDQPRNLAKSVTVE